MWGKFKNSFMYSMGLIGLVCFFYSLFLDSFNIRALQMCYCFGIPVFVFSFFTFELKLFSRHIWVRRGIVMLVTYCFVVGICFAFDILTVENWKKTLLAVLPVFAVLILGKIFFYYVSDKIEKRNLEEINQKLADNQTHSEQ